MSYNKEIQIISKYATSKENGFETRIFTIARLLVKRGYCVTIVTSNSNHLAHFSPFKGLFKTEEIGGIKVYWINTLKYNKSISLMRILSWFDFELKLFILLLFKVKISDILIVSSLSLLSIINGLIFKKNKTKLIFEIRDIWPLTLVEEGNYSPGNIAVKFLALIEKTGYLRSDYIIGTMPNLKAHVHSITKNKNLKVGFVPFGYKYNPSVTVKSIITNKIKELIKDKFVLCYCGTISLTNGLDSLIKTIKLYDTKNINDVFFLIVGDGLMSLDYQKYLSNCNNVIFTGKVSRESVQAYLKISDLLYFSSLPSKVWDYGWSPNKLIDYMSSEKPVLAAYDGHRSMINESDSGFFIKSNDVNELDVAIQNIKIMEKDKLIKMGKNGKKWLLENRTWEKVTDSYENIFDELIDINKI